MTVRDPDRPSGNPYAPPDAADLARFAALQQRLAESFTAIFENPAAPKTVVVIPSLSLDQEVMAKVSGAHHYEERMLCLLLLLRMPRTQVVYVTSRPIAEPIIDYYLHLLPGIPGQHARRRLTLVSCDDASPVRADTEDFGAAARACTAATGHPGSGVGAHDLLHSHGIGAAAGPAA